MTAEHSGKQGQRVESTVEYVAFLTRSEHRCNVLNLLADGTDSREGLRDRLDASRVTLSRILGDLEDRGLIQRRRSDRGYELTSFGEAVHRDLVRLQGTITVGQTYPKLISRLPTDWFDFDLRCLADGEHVHGKSEDPLAAARIISNAIKDGSACESLVGTFTSLPMYGYEQAIQNGHESEVHVTFDSNVTETMLEDPSLHTKWREIESQVDSTVYFSLDDRVPCTVDLIDGETVFFTVARDQENGFDIISCSHPDVVAWADRVIEEYRNRAVPLAERTIEADCRD